MSKTAIIYWSGTGNTEAMANAIAEGAAGNADLFNVSEISADKAAEYDNLILGCPAMGSENLEDSEFEPFFNDLKANLAGKGVALFGSYGWGGGEWMRNWVDEVSSTGAKLLNGDGLMVNEAPDDDAIESCRELGKSVAAL